MHRKISEMPRKWPLARKGRKYLARASDGSKDSLPILFALRDILEIAKTRREAKKICLQGQLKINGKLRKDEGFPMRPRDVLEIEEMNKTFVLVQDGKKFVLKEEKINKKISKIIGKKILAGNKVQANLGDGTNRILKEKFSCGDSLVIEFERKDSGKIIPLGKGSRVEVIGGKHISNKGKILDVKKEGEKEVFEVKLDGGKQVLLKKEILLAIE
jgi:small subunit ribosomal protein S4e